MLQLLFLNSSVNHHGRGQTPSSRAIAPTTCGTVASHGDTVTPLAPPVERDGADDGALVLLAGGAELGEEIGDVNEGNADVGVEDRGEDVTALVEFGCTVDEAFDVDLEALAPVLDDAPAGMSASRAHTVSCSVSCALLDDEELGDAELPAKRRVLLSCLGQRLIAQHYAPDGHKVSKYCLAASRSDAGHSLPKHDPPSNAKAGWQKHVVFDLVPIRPSVETYRVHEGDARGTVQHSLHGCCTEQSTLGWRLSSTG
ncbi:hypothetical protein FA95DRAFT_684771 [Auriscalpium vulgare]|uniref:Uncharacterized protein n=1 Tax=Auriscalpium vulgare TaxID=40419 RepID=A0ACB8S0U8_9AGAM|nr:hypothetical protein FA95DRAFT_684771 [Auriscalpium vulgare]